MKRKSPNIPLYTTELSSHDVVMPRMLKTILKSFVSPVDNPKAQGDPTKMRALEDKMATSFLGRLLYGKTIPLWRVEDVLIPSNSSSIQARVYIPGPRINLPAIIFFHGGGYVIGSITTYDKLCRKMARDLEAVIISVEYRLAPENKFPDAPQDGWTAVQWVFTQSRLFSINPSKIYVMGDSAGGGIAAVMAARSRTVKTISIAGQILIYPWLDGNLDSYPSMHKFREGFVLSRQNLEYFRDAYMSSPEDLTHPDFSPLLLEDFTELPPTFLITASHDPLRDQAYAFAQKLHEAGNDLIFKNYQPMMHGFVSAHKTLPLGKQMYLDTIQTIEGMFTTGNEKLQ